MAWMPQSMAEKEIHFKKELNQMNQQLALAIQLNDEATLAGFNWQGNALLQQQLLNILANTGERILYLWGPHGSGKSHLLQACCQQTSATRPAIYLPLSLLKQWGPESIEGLEEQHLICIDDIDFIAGDPLWEEALFHLFNKIKDDDKNLLIIANLYPPNLSTLQLADLRSRLSWGLILQLHELNDEEKINTLKLHAAQRGFELSTSVGHFLLKRCSRNMHDLHQLLNRLDKASLQAQRKITIPFVKDTLQL